MLAVIGVEAFNEYFDSRMGTDRVFNPDDVPPMSGWVLWLGIAAFAGALAVGIYLTYRGGWPILAFAVLGGLAAIFYVAPPIRWAYRGLGETVIALSYGPWMVLGSLYLHTGAVSWGALWASLVPGFLIMALAVVNAIPDYHQDRLVGKRNLVVRLGRRRGVWLYLALAAAGLAAAAAGVVAGVFPVACLAALLALPLLVSSARIGAAHLRVAAPVRAGDPRDGRLLPRRRRAVRRGPPRMTLNRAEPDRQPESAALRFLADSRATAISPACIAAPIRRPASACRTSWTPTRRCGSSARSSATRCRTSCCAAASRWWCRTSSDRGSAGGGRRAAQDRNQRPALRRRASPSGSPGCRSARSR